jgi:hypothetical protein
MRFPENCRIAAFGLDFGGGKTDIHAMRVIEIRQLTE